MLSAALFLLCNSLFLSLHLTGSPGSFPKPLAPARERECLERAAAGDLEAAVPRGGKRGHRPPAGRRERAQPSGGAQPPAGGSYY